MLLVALNFFVLFKQTKLNQIVQFISGLPRFSFEVLLVFIFAGLVFIMTEAKKDMVDIIQLHQAINDCLL